MKNCASLLISALLALPVAAISQQSTVYTAPRNEFGQPDFQGVWKTEFATMLERPDNLDSLVISEQEAEQYAERFMRGFTEGNTDPDFTLAGNIGLAKVKGEYRTSIIVHPENGKLPYSQAGGQLAGEMGQLFNQGFDGPEQRPLSERCLESLGYAPVRTLPLVVPRLIVQTQDHMVFHTEDAAGFRLIHLHDGEPEEAIPTVEGYSSGYWEGDTLVVETTNFRDFYPSRLHVGRTLVYGQETRITERFTRVADEEIFYRFTVYDEELYTEAWSGEFSFDWLGGITYEYACHEGNYSMAGILRGGQVQDTNQ